MRFVGKGAGPSDEPRIGTYFSLGIALVAIALGDLNVIAPILTMFFLATYAVVNVVSAVERFLWSPSFRPTFKVHWALSALGAVGCTAVRAVPTESFGSRRRIDVWLHGIRGNGALMLTLSHLLATSLEWRGASVTVRTILTNPGGADEARENLSNLIKAARIDAEVEIMVDKRPVTEVISETSRTADIAFLGLPTPDVDDITAFADVLESLIVRTGTIPAVAFVLASKSADLELTLN